MKSYKDDFFSEGSPPNRHFLWRLTCCEQAVFCILHRRQKFNIQSLTSPSKFNVELLKSYACIFDIIWMKKRLLGRLCSAGICATILQKEEYNTVSVNLETIIGDIHDITRDPQRTTCLFTRWNTSLLLTNVIKKSMAMNATASRSSLNAKLHSVAMCLIQYV